MPKAVIAQELGPPENYSLSDHDPGFPGDCEVQIAVKSVGVSFADILIAGGKYQVLPQVPFIPGTECAGIVTAVGSGVSGIVPGMAVTAKSFGGLFAEKANVAHRSVRILPAGLDLDEAAVLSLSYATAWYALHQRGGLLASETLLVLGAAGGTGYAAIQVAKHIGARVIASASSAEKRALAKAAGADLVIDSTSKTWREELKTALDGTPIDVVFDPVGGELTELAFRSLGWNGRHLVIGFAGGIASLRTNLPLLKGSALIGVDIRQFEKFEPAQFKENLVRIFECAVAGSFKPAIGRRFALSDFAAAMTAVAAGKDAGRIILNP